MLSFPSFRTVDDALRFVQQHPDFDLSEVCVVTDDMLDDLRVLLPLLNAQRKWIYELDFSKNLHEEPFSTYFLESSPSFTASREYLSILPPLFFERSHYSIFHYTHVEPPPSDEPPEDHVQFGLELVLETIAATKPLASAVFYELYPVSVNLATMPNDLGRVTFVGNITSFSLKNSRYLMPKEVPTPDRTLVDKDFKLHYPEPYSVDSCTLACSSEIIPSLRELIEKSHKVSIQTIPCVPSISPWELIMHHDWYVRNLDYILPYQGMSVSVIRNLKLSLELQSLDFVAEEICDIAIFSRGLSVDSGPSSRYSNGTVTFGLVSQNVLRPPDLKTHWRKVTPPVLKNVTITPLASIRMVFWVLFPKVTAFSAKDCHLVIDWFMTFEDTDPFKYVREGTDFAFLKQVSSLRLLKFMSLQLLSKIPPGTLDGLRAISFDVQGTAKNRPNVLRKIWRSTQIRLPNVIEFSFRMDAHSAGPISPRWFLPRLLRMVVTGTQDDVSAMLLKDCLLRFPQLHELSLICDPQGVVIPHRLHGYGFTDSFGFPAIAPWPATRSTINIHALTHLTLDLLRGRCWESRVFIFMALTHLTLRSTDYLLGQSRIDVEVISCELNVCAPHLEVLDITSFTNYLHFIHLRDHPYLKRIRIRGPAYVTTEKPPSVPPVEEIDIKWTD